MSFVLESKIFIIRPLNLTITVDISELKKELACVRQREREREGGGRKGGQNNGMHEV